MRDRASVVIIGAGIVGCSTAYHLTQKGWRDIVVLEQGPLFATGGSTSHAPGLVFQTNASKTMTELASYVVKLYRELELGGEPCFYSVGSLEVAQTKERWDDLKRKFGFAQSWGVSASLLTPEEAQQKLPLLDPGQIYGAFSVPSDGIAKAVRIAEALGNKATEHGARFYGHTPVTNIEVANSRVQAVVTPNGRVETDLVLVCTGIWGPRVGRMAGVPIPLIPVQHQYVKTTPLPQLAGETREVVHPILRHQDKSLYFRQHADHYGIGSYQHEPLLVEADQIRSYQDSPIMPSIREFTPEHFAKPWTDAVQLLPALRQVDLTYKINGMFSFTPDGLPLLGETPDVRGLWVAEAVWVTHAGGVGKVMAEWIAEDRPSIDLRECNINRFESYAHSPAYIKARGAQQYREVYDIIHPLQQMENPRPLRVSPFYGRHKELGAVFFEGRGWERPQWFASNEALLSDYDVPPRSGWEARYWSPLIGAEHQATRERVALYDMTPLVRVEVTGPGALEFLQKLTTNQIDKRVGRIIYTLLLDEKGGVKTDATIARLAETRFQVGCNGPLDVAWLRLHQPADGSVQIHDITSQYCGIGVWGPRARDLVQRLSEDDLSNESFKYFTARQIFLREVPVTTLRLSFVGELGWELYAPMEYGQRLWDLLWEAGQPLGVIAAGRGAFDSLRLEKGYRVWGSDVHTEYNPYEAGLDFAVKLDKGDFIGREALIRIQEQGISRQLCCLTLDDPNSVVMGKEPILDDDRVLGYVTSATCGYSIGRGIAYGYLPQAYAVEGTKVEIEYFGNRYCATVAQEPLYDPNGSKLRG
jgi:glycine cleavage system aminomethyltransferase T/glycine/D-amino acid oxidase-like deaminating enzyme